MSTKSAFVAAVVLLVGCGQASRPAEVVTHGHTHNPHDHNHARGKMLLASDGSTSVLLTAHLAKAGNELDMFVEGSDAKPKALPIATAIGRITGSRDDAQELRFTCAPAEERPNDEAEGSCSHFVARAPWIQPTDTLRVVSTLKVDGADAAFVWRDFNPRQYAHHEDAP